MTANTEVPNGSVRSTIDPNSCDHPGRAQKAERRNGGQLLNATVSGYLRTRLRLAWATISSAARRRCARGVMRTCRELTESLDRVRQLPASAETPADRDAGPALVDGRARRRESPLKKVNAPRSFVLERARDAEATPIADPIGYGTASTHSRRARARGPGLSSAPRKRYDAYVRGGTLGASASRASSPVAGPRHNDSASPHWADSGRRVPRPPR